MIILKAINLILSNTRKNCSRAIRNVSVRVIQTSSKIVSKPNKLKFSQTTASPNFSEEGKFAGNTIGKIAGKLKNGGLKPKDVPIEFITRGKTNLILNTRSSLALSRANIPVQEWNLINRTGNTILESNLSDRLAKNILTNTGTDVIRITLSGFGQNASSLK